MVWYCALQVSLRRSQWNGCPAQHLAKTRHRTRLHPGQHPAAPLPTFATAPWTTRWTPPSTAPCTPFLTAQCKAPWTAHPNQFSDHVLLRIFAFHGFRNQTSPLHPDNFQRKAPNKKSMKANKRIQLSRRTGLLCSKPCEGQTAAGGSA